jgi:hypothetical protein
MSREQFTGRNSERFVRMPKKFEWAVRLLFAASMLSVAACQSSGGTKSDVLDPNASFSNPATRAGAE